MSRSPQAQMGERRPRVLGPKKLKTGGCPRAAAAPRSAKRVPVLRAATPRSPRSTRSVPQMLNPKEKRGCCQNGRGMGHKLERGLFILRSFQRFRGPRGGSRSSKPTSTPPAPHPPPPSQVRAEPAAPIPRVVYPARTPGPPSGPGSRRLGWGAGRTCLWGTWHPDMHGRQGQRS